MGFLGAALLQAGTAAVGGILGGEDARDARDEQRFYIDEAVKRNDSLSDDFRTRANAALAYNQKGVDLLAGLPQEIREGFDAATVMELNRLAEDRQKERAATEQQFGAAGLGGTTVAAQTRRAIDRMAGRAFAETSAKFAQGRAGAVAGATGMAAGAIAGQAGMMGEFAAREAALRQFGSQILSNVQIQPANTGAQIGALGAGISGLMQGYDLIDALKAGGGAPDPRAAALDSWGRAGGGLDLPSARR